MLGMRNLCGAECLKRAAEVLDGMNAFEKSLAHFYAVRGYTPAGLFPRSGKHIERVESREGPLLVKAALPGRPGRFYRIMRDWDVLEQLQGIPGVPRPVGLFSYTNGSWSNTRPSAEEIEAARKAQRYVITKGLWLLRKNTSVLFVRQFIEGPSPDRHPLRASDIGHLEETILRIHKRSVARLDIHKNNLVMASRPYVFDFDHVTTPNDATFEQDRENDLKILEGIKRGYSIDAARERAKQ